MTPDITSWPVSNILACLTIVVTLNLVLAVHHVRTDDEPQDWKDYQLGESPENFYQHVVTDIDGRPHNLSQYSGKASLVVNVASQCGYTDDHYRDLVHLHDELSPSGHFTVLAFPSNQFGEQEPWSENEIKSFVKQRYQVNFPVFSKTSVRGHDVPGCWHFLTESSGHEPTWNFWKYLVNHDGEVLHAWGPWVNVPSITPIVQQAVQQAARVIRTQDEL